MSRIAVDMDEVISDALSKHVSLYNQHFKRQVTADDLHGQSLVSFAAPEERQKLVEFVEHESFFRDLKVIPGAVETLKDLSENHELFITTAAMEFPTSFTAKYQWLVENLPFISPLNFVFCGDKSIVQSDYLIDDNVRHFARFKGQGILFDAPHNRLLDFKPRVSNWADVAEFFALSA